MRIRVIVATGFIICISLTIIGFEYWHFNHISRWHQTLSDESAATQSPNGKISSYSENGSSHSSALQYCNFPSSEDIASSEEGLKPGDNFTLEQVIVVIRHGDRSPMGQNVYKKFKVTPDYCNIEPGRPPTRSDLAAFYKTISEDQIKLMRQGWKLPMSPLPNSKVCGIAMLSQLGVVQHMHNGEILRKRYIKNNNFLSSPLHDRNLLRDNIHVVTTTRTRTMQSAVALLYGLIPNFRLPEVQIHYSASDTFHLKHCEALSAMAPFIKKVQYQSYLGNRKKSSIKKLAKVFDMNDHPGVLIDSFINGFLCKGIQLPCNNGECIDLEDLNELIDAEEHTTRELSLKSPYVNQSMLIGQPLLEKLTNFMLRKLKRTTVPDFVLFSGHDTTLKILIRTLGITEYRWPPLGSRLVFELWSDAQGENAHIKILMNGKDYTLKTKPCIPVKEKGSRAVLSACPFKTFHDFVMSGIPLHFNQPTRQEVCSST